jgi:UDP-N-acetylmuramate dehydrogenase
MTIQNNFSLKKYNTFGIEAKAKQFVAVHSIEDLNTILKEHQSERKFILGGGSNAVNTEIYPDGPDVLTIVASNVGTETATLVGRVSWTEAQA